MEIEKTTFVKERMDGHGHVMADSEYGTKRIGTWPQVSNLAQVFQGVTFFLKRALDQQHLFLNLLAGSHI